MRSSGGKRCFEAETGPEARNITPVGGGARMGSFGTTELIIILVILLLLFGTRLPSVMRSLGKSVNEFKKGMNEITELPEDEKKDKGQG